MKVDESNVEDCTRRWKAIRDRFVRELKKVKTRKSGDAGPVYVPSWPLFESNEHQTDTNITYVNHYEAVVGITDGQENNRVASLVIEEVRSGIDRRLDHNVFSIHCSCIVREVIYKFTK